MTQKLKLLLSFPSLYMLGLCISLFIYWKPIEKSTSYGLHFFHFVITGYILMIPQCFFLIKRIWKFSSLKLSQKWVGAIYMIFWNPLFPIWYIWKKDDLLIKENAN